MSKDQKFFDRVRRIGDMVPLKGRIAEWPGGVDHPLLQELDKRRRLTKTAIDKATESGLLPRNKE